MSSQYFYISYFNLVSRTTIGEGDGMLFFICFLFLTNIQV